MSIKDSIDSSKEKLEENMRRLEEQKKKEKEIDEILDIVGLIRNAPLLTSPALELQPILHETMPYMQFIWPKVLAKLPDGRTLIGLAAAKECRNVYSFDIVLQTNGTGKGSWVRYMWIFKNGEVAFSQSGVNVTWDEIKDSGITPSEIRKIIIDTIAYNSIQAEKSSKHCYIATAVYGSYDCPEVRILRRFRDFTLQNSLLGRLFIKSYYRISPILLKWFGHIFWFKRFCKFFLDKMIFILKSKGVSDETYND